LFVYSHIFVSVCVSSFSKWVWTCLFLVWGHTHLCPQANQPSKIGPYPTFQPNYYPCRLPLIMRSVTFFPQVRTQFFSSSKRASSIGIVGMSGINNPRNISNFTSRVAPINIWGVLKYHEPVFIHQIPRTSYNIFCS